MSIGSLEDHVLISPDPGYQSGCSFFFSLLYFFSFSSSFSLHGLEARVYAFLSVLDL